MQFKKIRSTAVPVVCASILLMSAAVIGQSAKTTKTDTAATATKAKTLKTETPATAAKAKKLTPQTTCPVMGNAIDKKLFVDYNGKRIYVCCSDCIAEVTKDPEKYINKLDSLGQSVEIITNTTTTTVTKKSAEVTKETNNAAPADTAKKTIGTKDKKKTAAVAAPAADAGYWTCSMHPEIHQAEAGVCPKCGMKLVFKANETDTTKMKNMNHSKKKM